MANYGSDRETHYDDFEDEEVLAERNRRFWNSLLSTNCPFGVFKCEQCEKFENCTLKSHKNNRA